MTADIADKSQPKEIIYRQLEANERIFQICPNIQFNFWTQFKIFPKSLSLHNSLECWKEKESWNRKLNWDRVKFVICWPDVQLQTISSIFGNSWRVWWLWMISEIIVLCYILLQLGIFRTLAESACHSPSRLKYWFSECIQLCLLVKVSNNDQTLFNWIQLVLICSLFKPSVCNGEILYPLSFTDN